VRKEISSPVKNGEKKEVLMNRITALLTAAFTVFAALFIFSMSISPNWTVQRRIFINERPARITPYLSDVSSWKKWNTWSEKQGISKIKIMKAGANTVKYSLTNTMTGNVENGTAMVINSDLGSYVVEKIEGKSNADPLTRYLLLMHEKLFGEDIENGLMTLKNEVERK
jgi:predicted PurR-regulated permease PerM